MINSSAQNEGKKSFVNKFTNIELYFKQQDEKRSIILQDGMITSRSPLLSFEGKPSVHVGGPRKSRKSIMFSPPPRKSFMLESKTDFAIANNEKNKTILKTLDLNNYSSDQLLDLTVNVLQKPSNYRSSSDIKILVKATENIKFFQEISNEKGLEIHEQICRYMTHKYLSGGDVVFQEVCKYEIQQIIPPVQNILPAPNSTFLNCPEKLRFSFKKSESIVTSLVPKRSESIQADLYATKFRKDNSGDSIQSPTKKTPSPEKREVLTEVRVLETGNSFGELALLENKPRAATIKCKENCHFAVLDKQFFLHILKENEQRKLFQHIDFFSNLILFKHWTYNEVKNLKLHSEIMEFKRNKFVYGEGDQSEFFYIVRTGEFKILKELTVMSDQDLMDKKLRQTNIPKFTNPKLAKKTMFDIAILMPGEFFGEEELIEGTVRKFSVLCVHPGSLYAINKKEFSRRIMNDSGSKNHLLKELKEKEKWRSARMREYIFFHSKTNTFIKELACHQNLLKDFSINEMDLLLKTEDLGEQDIFSQDQEEKASTEAKFALKSKISTILSQAQSQNKDFFFLGLGNRAKTNSLNQKNQSLYDYFMEINKKKFFHGDLEKMKSVLKKKHDSLKKYGGKICLTSRENTEKLDEFIEKTVEKNGRVGHVTLPLLGNSPLKKIKEKMHFFLNFPLPLLSKDNNTTTSRSIERKIGYLSDRREYYKKPQTMDFGIDLIKNKVKVSETKNNDQEDFKVHLPLKYRSQEIYQKILDKTKKIRGFREKSSERTLSSLVLPSHANATNDFD